MKIGDWIPEWIPKRQGVFLVSQRRDWIPSDVYNEVMSNEPLPEYCEYQVVKPGKSLPTFGGTVVVRDSYLCYEKAAKDRNGRMVMTFGIECDYKDNEGNCPLRASARAAGHPSP